MKISIPKELENEIIASIEAGNFEDKSFIDFKLHHNAKIRVSKETKSLMPVKIIENNGIKYYIGIASQ